MASTPVRSPGGSCAALTEWHGLAQTARALGLTEAASVVVSTNEGSIELPLCIADVVEGAVWIPMTSGGSRALAIGASHGSRVRVTGGRA